MIDVSELSLIWCLILKMEKTTRMPYKTHKFFLPESCLKHITLFSTMFLINIRALNLSNEFFVVHWQRWKAIRNNLKRRIQVHQYENKVFFLYSIYKEIYYPHLFALILSYQQPKLRLWFPNTQTANATTPLNFCTKLSRPKHFNGTFLE